jgi:hypothetical protein
MYKSAVVIITEKYVAQQSHTPAAAIAKEVFDAMLMKCWHNARLSCRNNSGTHSPVFQAIDEFE